MSTALSGLELPQRFGPVAPAPRGSGPHSACIAACTEEWRSVLFGTAFQINELGYELLPLAINHARY
jgi:hypothetical protein